jgi:tripartite-type tricarboxylate transporter receptor subunit TctC
LKNIVMAVSAALASFAAAGLPGMAAEYPAKDIRVVVPWGAGGGTDAISRKIMNIADKSLPVTVYVENVDGGLSSIGLNRVMSARPDGYTLGVLTYDSIITVPWKNLLPSYDLKRLKIIARITSEPNALMVSKASGYNSFAEIVDAAKKNPNTIKLAITSLGGMPHLALARMQEETGTSFRAVSYPDGSAGQKEAVLSGEVAAAITSLGDFAPVIQSGDVKGLVEFGDTKNAAFADVPISKDVGLKMTTGSFILIAVPANTPDDVAKKLEDTLHAAYDTDEFREWTKTIGVTPSWLGSAEMEPWIKSVQSEIFAQLDELVAQGAIQK